MPPSKSTPPVNEKGRGSVPMSELLQRTLGEICRIDVVLSYIALGLSRKTRNEIGRPRLDDSIMPGGKLP
jgi:hypothetical protein